MRFRHCSSVSEWRDFLTMQWRRPRILRKGVATRFSTRFVAFEVTLFHYTWQHCCYARTMPLLLFERGERRAAKSLVDVRSVAR